MTDHLVAGTRRLTEIEVDDLALLRRLDLLDLVERLDPALHLGSLCRLRLEPIDEALFLRQHRLLASVGRFLVGFADRPFALVEVVVT